MNEQQINELIYQQVAAALRQPLPPSVLEDLQKAWTQPASATSGLNAYDLEKPAKLLYPVLTPLRNEIPRIADGVGTAVNWRAITGINTTRINAGVSQGNRGAVITSSTADYTAAYKGIGQEDYVTFEADYAARSFDDVRARAVQGLLNSVMIAEEYTDLGGNGAAVALGQPNAPAASQSTGGSIADATYNVIVMAVTLDGWYQAGSPSEGALAGTAGVPPATTSRTNADATSDTINGGCSIKSNPTGITVSAGSGAASILVSTTVVAGAVGYIWFVGTAASEKSCWFSFCNSAKITALNGTGVATTNYTADRAKNALVYDGLLYQAWQSGSGSIVVNQATGTPGTGTPLTSDGAGGIVEIDSVLRQLWDTYRLNPDVVWISSREAQNTNKKVIAGGSAPLFRFLVDGTVKDQSVIGGSMVGNYFNKFGMGGGKLLKLQIHPFMPPGTMLFQTKTLPYKLSNVSNIIQKKLRRDYYQLEWPQRTRKYEYGVYCDGVLQNYFPPAFAILTNIADG